jgi:glucose/arabinose dehydrogenase
MGRHGSAVLALFALTLTPALVASGATLPSGFSETQVASGLAQPTAMAFAPDGRLFLALQGGSLRVVKNGALLPTAFLTVTVDASGERGLLGVALDPDFATNRHVYIYYTATSPTVHNRLSRFTASGDVAVPGSEVVILELDNLTSATNHNGGALHFGPDGKLYVAVGENATSSNSQVLTNLLGKILRINPDGTLPTDNPFHNTATGQNRAIWALGLRNPFTFAIDPSTGKMFINDVGQNAWEEINDGQAGANYGWPATEGYTSNPAYESPVYAYANGASTCAITGGTFYSPAVTSFPLEYRGQYFFADYCAGWIRRVDPADNTSVTDFATGLSFPVDLRVTADGSLYYLARGSGSNTGVVSRIQYTAGQAPTITTQPSSQTVATGQPATFSVVVSGTAPLSYQWRRNGAAISGATTSSYTLGSATAADSGASFQCVISNAFGTTTSLPATLTVTSNRPPTGVITTPSAGMLYTGGQTITYGGSASDPEQGSLPASAFTWEVRFHHEDHNHPVSGPTSGVTGGSFTVPTTGETSANVFYRIMLTVTDSQGLTHTTYRDVLPRTATLTLTASVPGLQLTLDGQPGTAPFSVLAVVGMRRSIGASTRQTVNGTTYQFRSWSDGGPATHNITVPAVNTTYAASYRQKRK